MEAVRKHVWVAIKNNQLERFDLFKLGRCCGVRLINKAPSAKSKVFVNEPSPISPTKINELVMLCEKSSISRILFRLLLALIRQAVLLYEKVNCHAHIVIISTN